MAITKVVVFAVSVGFLFAVCGMVLIENIERAVGKSAPLIVMFLACAGGILGGIAGSTQAIVDAIDKKGSS